MELLSRSRSRIQLVCAIHNNECWMTFQGTLGCNDAVCLGLLVVGDVVGVLMSVKCYMYIVTC